MFRLIGFVFGAALTLVLLTAIVDAPTRESVRMLLTDSVKRLVSRVDRQTTELHTGTAAGRVSAAGVPPTIEDLSLTKPLRDHGSPLNAPAHELQTSVERSSGASLAAGAVLAEAAPTTVSEPPNAAVLHDAGVADERTSAIEGVPAWQPLWQSFRSELSAKGFAAHLRRLTGQQYRVRRTGPWVYQVELAYRDERQLEAVLREVQAKTGLGLTRSEP